MDVQTALRQFGPQRVGIADQAEFGRAIGSPQRHADLACDAGNEDQLSRSALDQMREQGLGRGDLGEQVDFDDVAIDLEVRIDGRAALGNPRIGDEDIDAVPCHRFFARPVHRRLVAYVEGKHERFRVERFGDLAKPRFVAPRQDQPRPASGPVARQRRADAAARPGDPHGLVFETHKFVLRDRSRSLGHPRARG